MHVLAIFETDLFDTLNEFKVYITLSVNPCDCSSLGGFLIGEKSQLFYKYGVVTYCAIGHILNQRLSYYSRFKWMRVLCKAVVEGYKEESRPRQFKF